VLRARWHRNRRDTRESLSVHGVGSILIPLVVNVQLQPQPQLSCLGRNPRPYIRSYDSADGECHRPQRELIKEKKMQHAFRDVDADRLKLWKVSHLISAI
jgi:hypothetical protein